MGLLAARRPEPVMTVARSVADVLADHAAFEVESIDRMYLNVWQPRLAYGGGVQGFFVGHRGFHYASTALMDPMTKAFVADIHGFVAARGLELVSFVKGQRKDDLAQEYLARCAEAEGVLFVGRAQEKAGVWRTQRRYNPVCCDWGERVQPHSYPSDLATYEGGLPIAAVHDLFRARVSSSECPLRRSSKPTAG